MKILSVVGARPNFMKIAPIISTIKSYNAGSSLFSSTPDKGTIDHFLVHTGQHYDPMMSQVFFEEMEIPHPAVNLQVGSGNHGKATGAMLAARPRGKVRVSRTTAVASETLWRWRNFIVRMGQRTSRTMLRSYLAGIASSSLKGLAG